MAGKKPKPEKKPSHAWDVHEIQELIDVLIKREITDFEFEKGGVRIRVKRGKARVKTLPPAPFAAVPFAEGPALAPQTAAEMLPTASEVGKPPAPESTEDLFIIKSPIVGTFFSSSSPNAPPFVKVSDVVPVGQVLCIIEAMKLMNEIESEVAGEIARIYVDNGQPVEYGQSLFAIRPGHKK